MPVTGNCLCRYRNAFHITLRNVNMEHSICANCKMSLSSGYRFCPQCGQKNPTDRLTLKQIRDDVIHAFLHADKGIFNLVKELAVRPGFVAREYVDGKRKKYFNPFTFLVLVVGLSTFAFSAFNVLRMTAAGPQTTINNYIYKHYNLIVFLNVPVVAYFSWMFNRNSGRNYAENLVLTALLSGERALAFSLIIAPMFYFFNAWSYYILGAYVLMWLVYYAWGSQQFFEKKTIGFFFRSLLPPFITQVITTGAMTAAILFYYYNLKNR